MLGQLRHCLGMRAVAGVDWRALRCWGRRATASGLKGILQSTCCWMGSAAKSSGLKGMLQSTCCWMGRVAKSRGGVGHGVCHGGRWRTTMGPSPDAGTTATYTAIPPSPPTETPIAMRVADYLTSRRMVLLPCHRGSSVAITTPLVIRPPLLLRCPLPNPPRDDIATAVVTASSTSPTRSHHTVQRLLS